MKTNNHEVIFTIVNSGFAEEAMRVAREQGVRGGTILGARGVVNENMWNSTKFCEINKQ